MPRSSAKALQFSGRRATILAQPISRVAGWFVIALGLSILLAWATNMSALAGIIPGINRMNPMTAVCVIMMGSTLLLPRGAWSPASRVVRSVLGCAVAAIGAVKLFSVVTGRDFGTDLLIFGSRVAADGNSHIAPNTAICLILLGSAVTLGATRSRKAIAASQLFALGVAFVVLAALTGYAYGAINLYQFPRYGSMALPTALALGWIVAGLLSSRPAKALMGIATNSTFGGKTARRFLPIVVVVPFLLGGIRVFLKIEHLVDEITGIAMLVTSMMLTLFAATMLFAESLRRAEATLAHRQRLLGEAERRYRLMAENVTDVIITTDLRGRTTFVAPSYQSVTGYAPEDLIGRNPAEHAHPDDIPNMMRVFRNIADGQAGESFRWRLRHKLTNEWLWLESNPSLLPGERLGEKPRFLDVIRDVTTQVAQELALALATVEAKSAAAAKSEFLANMSHEIRTPLTAIVGFSGLLSGHAGLDDVARGYAERVASAGNALLALVNDVLDFSKLEAGKVEIKPRPVSPINLARDALLMFTPQAHAKGLSLDFVAEDGIPDYLELDPDRLRQILLNLVGNAVKFTEHGSVRLRVRYEVDRLHIAVEDTGAGLTKSAKAKLFQRFSQVDGSTTRRFGGTGLGLSICKGLTEAMGGEIGVQSRLGKGSTFRLHIVAPIADAPEMTETGAIALPALDGVRVLVVDDNPFNRELVRAVLEQSGAEITEAENGQQAVLAACAMPYDVILMDVRMPVLDGPAALQRIRSEPGPNRAIPVLAFTADPDLHRFVEIDGFDDVVAKPIRPPSLVQAIARWTEYGVSPPNQEIGHAILS